MRLDPPPVAVANPEHAVSAIVRSADRAAGLVERSLPSSDRLDRRRSQHAVRGQPDAVGPAGRTGSYYRLRARQPPLRNGITRLVGRYQRYKPDLTLTFVNPDLLPDRMRGLGLPRTASCIWNIAAVGKAPATQ